MLLSGDAAVVGSAIVLNGTMIGGILGMLAILMAYRPEKLRQSPRRKRLAIVFGCAGICAEVLYFVSGGSRDVSSHFLARWVMLGPVVVGIHCAYRVYVHPAQESPAAAP
jgi:hypothetical protein